jgi:hypothetical protein
LKEVFQVRPSISETVGKERHSSHKFVSPFAREEEEEEEEEEEGLHCQTGLRSK